jgi:cellulose synthase/poly-beta-1,6-N-acetylglucosamine synthase-like glycosyltransferase
MLASDVTVSDLHAPFEEPVWTSANLSRVSTPESAPAAAGRDDGLAIEIAFLADYGVPYARLLAATRAAHGDVTADQALLAEGDMREEEFYRLLARHLALPYYCGEIAIVECPDPAGATRRGSARLAPNAQGMRFVLAPRGPTLAKLLEVAAAKGLPNACFITSPQRLAAIIRFQMGGHVAEEAAGALEWTDAALSAHSGLTKGQWACAILLAACALVLGLQRPEILNAICAAALWLVFFASVVLRFAAALAGDRGGAPPPLDDFDLPVYSIIAPLKREANVVSQLIQALDGLDYPKYKLDIKIVVERDDSQTLAALAQMRLPSRYDIIVAPPGAPATKPRALNIALPLARGDLIVIYDAEDVPAPDQLRRAAARFAEDETIDCLQARLVVQNVDVSWLTKLFAIEYAALFDIVNPGLASLGAPIALGGSSNHFRTSMLRQVGGWDAWNVTEDADLGLRLARFGGRVATMDSDTQEEAPSHFKPWFNQRRRWLKGWFQTLAVHLRSPRRLVRELGPLRALEALTLMLGAVLGALLGPALLAYTTWRGLTGELFAAPTAWQAVVNIMTLLLMFLGFQAILIPIVLSLHGRGLQRLYRSLPLVPLYYCLISLAAWAALPELVLRPYYWSKTEHGLTRASGRD